MNDASQHPATAVQPNIATEIERLHTQCVSAILATTDADGHALPSYAPYAFLHGCYYVFVSGLAAHTQHILSNPNVGILIIEDESSARNIYARARLSYQTRATMIERDSAECHRVLVALRERVGRTMDVLSQLGDFVMMRLTPHKGSLVLGFGKAYALDGQNPDNAMHIDEAYLKNHR
ncbi:MAG: putative pyridoxamine 5-phosphate oxidase-like FMN-binding protein [Burkholderiaceae bacterium]|nr:putative pyridoxamine 5-phosphate oxidase-like FMN-binding protein [Burkholderiaceae bacterium]